MVNKNIAQEFRVKNIEGTRINFIEEINQN